MRKEIKTYETELMSNDIKVKSMLSGLTDPQSQAVLDAYKNIASETADEGLENVIEMVNNMSICSEEIEAIKRTLIDIKSIINEINVFCHHNNEA